MFTVEGLSPNSIRAYEDRLMALYKGLFNMDIPRDQKPPIKMLQDFDLVAKYLDELTPSTRNLTLVAINRVLYKKRFPNAIREQYIDLRRKSTAEHAVAIQKRDLTETEQKRIRPWPEFVEEARMTTGHNKLAAWMQVMMAPQRAVVLTNMKWHKGTNHVDLDKGVMSIGKDKTTPSFGVRVLPIPDELLAFLRVEGADKEPDSYMFLTKKGLPYTGNAWHSRLMTIFKAPSNTLRHSYATHMYELVNTKKQRDAVAYSLGHSLSTSVLLYDL